MTVTKIEKAGDLTAKITYNRTVVCHFMSGGSERSTKMEPLFESLAKENNTFDFLSIDIDHVEGVEDVTGVGEIDQTPTFMVFKAGKRTGITVRPDVPRLRKLIADVDAPVQK